MENEKKSRFASQSGYKHAFLCSYSQIEIVIPCLLRDK